MCASQHTPSDSGLKETFSRSHNSKFPRLEKTNIQPNKSLDLKLLNIKKMLMHQNCKWRKHPSVACFSISRGTDILTTGSQAVQLFHSLFQLWILIKKQHFFNYGNECENSLVWQYKLTFWTWTFWQTSQEEEEKCTFLWVTVTLAELTFSLTFLIWPLSYVRAALLKPRAACLWIAVSNRQLVLFTVFNSLPEASLHLLYFKEEIVLI